MGVEHRQASEAILPEAAVNMKKPAQGALRDREGAVGSPEVSRQSRRPAVPAIESFTSGELDLEDHWRDDEYDQLKLTAVSLANRPRDHPRPTAERQEAPPAPSQPGPPPGLVGTSVAPYRHASSSVSTTSLLVSRNVTRFTWER